MKEIIRNRAKCLMCGDIIESKHRNDFRICSCGNLQVEGGKDYIHHNAYNGRDSFLNLAEFAKYSWDEGFSSADGHAWVMGVDLLHCPRVDTGETVTLSISLSFMKNPMPVDCRIYGIPASLFDPTAPIRQVYVAICEYSHSAILFRDENSFSTVMDRMARCDPS